MLSDVIAAHLHSALTEAIHKDKAVRYEPAALVDAAGVGRLSLWDIAEIAAEAVSIHQSQTMAFCDWCGAKHIKGQGQWPMAGCPDDVA